jgi:ribokinase
MKKILNIGSINIDYVYDVEHFVRPGETISAPSVSVFPGGKGLNQSVAMARAGGNVYHAGRVGRDGLGMIDIMKDAGVDAGLVDSSGSATGHAIIQVNAAGENCIIIHPGANFELDRNFIDNALSSFGEGDFLVLQNEVNNVPYAMEAASRKGLRIAFNLAPFGPEINEYPLGLVDIFLVNETEGRGISGMCGPEEILDEMARRFPSAAVVLTLGSDGALYRGAGEKDTLPQGIYDVSVVDTTAAGDTFTGFFISLTAERKPPAEALRISAAAAAIAVSRKGASSSVPTLAETLAADLKYLGA